MAMGMKPMTQGRMFFTKGGAMKMMKKPIRRVMMMMMMKKKPTKPKIEGTPPQQPPTTHVRFTRPPTVSSTTFPTLSPVPVPLTLSAGFRCFESNQELRRAVGLYMNPLERQAMINLYGPIQNWCVGALSDFSRVFSEQSSFNEPLAGWDMSAATNLSFMFQGASAFNQPLAAWNVHQVTELTGMFHDASAFAQDLCAWAQKLPREQGRVSGMFAGANSCPSQSATPSLDATRPGPFCFQCVVV